MSYILDALRKSDQQRKRGVPLLLAAQAATNTPRRPPRLMHATVALVLLGAGVAIGWLRPWQQEETPSEARVVLKPAATANAAAPAPAAMLPRSSPERGAEESAPIGPGASVAAPQPGKAATIATAKPPAQLRPAAQESDKAVKQALTPRADTSAAPTPREDTVAAPTPREDTVAAPTPRADTSAAPTPRADTSAAPTPRANEGAPVESRALSRSAAAQPAVPTTSAPARADAQASAPAQTAVAINELPASIQKDLPALSVMVHAYSDDPAKRMVGINHRLLHEGDEVAPGLRLERITLDGMILNYKGYSFRRGVR